MTEQELRKLSRAELLELLLAECRENERLRAQLAEAGRRLRDRRIQIDRAGSIAQAALQLNGVFEAAQRAANQYVENVRRLADETYGTPRPQADAAWTPGTAAMPGAAPASPREAPDSCWATPTSRYEAVDPCEAAGSYQAAFADPYEVAAHRAASQGGAR